MRNKEDLTFPLIFLDIDHVLTNVEIDNSSYLNYDPSRYHISDENLKWLDMILDNANAKIIIASNWRKFIPPHTKWMYDGKWYESPLPEFKKRYDKYIVGCLPLDRHITKSEALCLWCEEHIDDFSMRNSSYVILEDDLREGYQAHPYFSKHLILTDYHYGLTEKDAHNAIKILNNEV